MSTQPAEGHACRTKEHTTPSIYTANDPAVYERSIGRWSRRLAKPFTDFAAISGATDLLDVGCGTGSLTLALADTAPGARMVGVGADQVVGAGRADLGDHDHPSL